METTDKGTARESFFYASSVNNKGITSTGNYMSHRKPTALKILEGNPGGRPLPSNEPTPELAIPQRPTHLDKEARKEWDRIVPELEKLNLIARIDSAALSAYCAAYGRWVQAEKMLKKEGLTTETHNGFVVKSPWLQIADKALEQIRRFCSEFGLTPASRTKVATLSPTDEDDDYFAVRK